jgi:replicative DNA helicase
LLVDPPAALSAEAQVLGAVLVTAGRALDDLVVGPREFADPRHKLILAACRRLADRGEPADPVSVADELARQPDDWGGPAYLAGLVEQTVTPAAAAHHAGLVRRSWALRAVAETGSRMCQDASGADADPDEVTARARRWLDGLDEHLAPLDVLDGAELAARALGGIGAQRKIVPTPWQLLNGTLGGWQSGRLHVAASRPGVGKSALCAQACLDAAETHHRPALLVSLEMPDVELGHRLLSVLAGVAHQRIAAGEMSEGEWTQVHRAHDRLAVAPMHVADKPHATVADIRAQARQLSRRVGPLGLLAVDYLQLLTPGERRESRQVEVAEMSRSLKLLARDLDCPVLVAAQVNRAPESRSDRRPRISDLRESGAIENDADVVLLLHHDDEREGEIELMLAKHRGGPTGTTTLDWEGEYARIRDRRWA